MGSKLPGRSSARSLWPIVVGGGLIMGLALGVRHAQGIFLIPITMDHGWSREAFGFAIAIQNLVWGISQPFTGMIADRFGSRPSWSADCCAMAPGFC